MAAQKQMPASASPKEASERTATSETAQPEAAQGIGGLSALSNPPLLRPTNLLGLQRSVGNQTVQRILRQQAPARIGQQMIQRTLSVGAQEHYDEASQVLDLVLQKGDYADYRLLILDQLTQWIKDNKTFTDWQELTGEIDKAIQATGQNYVEMGNKKFKLLGTTHGMVGQDISNQALPMQNASLILEYPSLSGTNRNTYNQEDIASVNDKTQAKLAKNAAENPNSIESIGADGRKAYDANDKIHSISIRHKKMSSYDVESEDLLDKDNISSAFEAYSLAAFSPEQDGASAIEQIGGFVTYLDNTDQSLVLSKTLTRLKQLSTGLTETENNAIAGKALEHLKADLTSTLNQYQSNIQELEALPEQYAAKNLVIEEQMNQLHKRNTEILEQIEQLKKAAQNSNNSPDNEAEQKLNEELIQNFTQLEELQSEHDSNKNFNVEIQKMDLVLSTNQDLVGALNDAICNLLLFTEAIGAQKPNVVVAFGAEHIKPLRELIEELKQANNNT
ncbi:MAG: hypothetical protein OHK0022_37830 [Roseiflexaceae bacterium]